MKNALHSVVVRNQAAMGVYTRFSASNAPQSIQTWPGLPSKKTTLSRREYGTTEKSGWFYNKGDYAVRWTEKVKGITFWVHIIFRDNDKSCIVDCVEKTDGWSKRDQRFVQHLRIIGYWLSKFEKTGLTRLDAGLDDRDIEIRTKALDSCFRSPNGIRAGDETLALLGSSLYLATAIFQSLHTGPILKRRRAMTFMDLLDDGGVPQG